MRTAPNPSLSPTRPDGRGRRQVSGGPFASGKEEGEHAPFAFVRMAADLIKLKLTAMATLPAGFAYIAGREGVDPLGFGGLILGVLASACGAAALNQWSERKTDTQMQRTLSRPLPSGKLRPGTAFATGILLLTAGTLLIAITSNPLAATLALTAGLLYWLAYTPLKKMTPWCTEVGAIAGALPPLIGWTAATGAPSPFAWFLFSILFLWQMPHFHPIAWRYRTDYRRAGLKMRAVIEPTGNQAATHSVVYSFLLLISGITWFVFGEMNLPAFGAFILLTTGYVFFASRFRFSKNRDTAARHLFVVSLIYLPLLLLVITLDWVGGKGF